MAITVIYTFNTHRFTFPKRSVLVFLYTHLAKSFPLSYIAHVDHCGVVSLAAAAICFHCCHVSFLSLQTS